MRVRVMKNEITTIGQPYLTHTLKNDRMQRFSDQYKYIECKRL
jgi:hypothetical protein